MRRTKPAELEAPVAKALGALGGEGTLGDLVALTGLPSGEVEEALEGLMYAERAEVKVSDSGELIYRQRDPGPGNRVARTRELLSRIAQRRQRRADARARQIWFDRRTLRLIRAREGVISLAELVEHTGLPLARAEREMERLAECYGGEPVPSWDGHAVHVFPDVMTSAHGRFDVREPRPAWVKAMDPMQVVEGRHRYQTVRVFTYAKGVAVSVAAPWLVAALLGPVGSTSILVASLASAAGIAFFGRKLSRAMSEHRRFRFRSVHSLRRYALGHVVETALKGKGVVSLGRTVKYLEARAGKRHVKRSAVEAALRALAEEFDAPITDQDGEIFFGFRNVKRQFLASDVVRRQLRMARTAFGRTVFDSGDSRQEATIRDLETFDRELASDYRAPFSAGRPPP